jgi:hypothetical protein
MRMVLADLTEAQVSSNADTRPQLAQREGSGSVAPSPPAAWRAPGMRRRPRRAACVHQRASREERRGCRARSGQSFASQTSKRIKASCTGEGCRVCFSISNTKHPPFRAEIGRPVPQERDVRSALASGPSAACRVCARSIPRLGHLIATRWSGQSSRSERMVAVTRRRIWERQRTEALRGVAPSRSGRARRAWEQHGGDDARACASLPLADFWLFGAGRPAPTAARASRWPSGAASHAPAPHAALLTSRPRRAAAGNSGRDRC